MKYFKYCTFLFILISLSNQAYSQIPQGYNITGKVIDAKSATPIEFATIAIYKVNDSVPITGNVADFEGNFNVPIQRPGNFDIKISFIGYETYKISNVKIPDASGNTTYNLGTIKLNVLSNSLNEVVVSEEKDIMQMSLDRKVYNVEKDLLVSGGTAADVLQNVPSVTIDMDNNIQLRGSGNIIVLIDGKPSSLTGQSRQAILDQIPANDIERIEIITNPGAKYDPDGTSGIINIVLKKNKKDGFTGSVGATVGTNDKYTGNIALSFKKKNFNYFLSYNYNDQAIFHNRYGLTEAKSGDTSAFVDNYGNGRNRSIVHNLRAGFDFSFKKHHSISFSAGVNQRDQTTPIANSIAYDFINNSRNIYERSLRISDEDNQRQSLDIALGYKRGFEDKNKSLSADLSYSGGWNNDILNARQDYYDENYGPGSLPTWRQNTLNKGFNYIITAQTDYVQALGNNKKLEIGGKITSRRVDNDFFSESFNSLTGMFENDVNISNRFIYDENIIAAYGIYSVKWSKYGFSGGLRLEQTFTESKQITTNERVPFNYFAPFPSFHFSRYFEKNREVRLGYSRRINRPGPRELNPFAEYNDPFNLMFGNPRLRPEFTHSVELGFIKIGKKYSFSPTLYYRFNNQMITRFRTVDAEGVTRTTFQNLNSSHNIGFEMNASYDIAKFWKVNANTNFYYSYLNGTNLEGAQTNNTYGLTMRINNTIKLPYGIDAQFSYSFWRWAMLQGVMSPVNAFDLGAKKDILKGQGSLTLRLSDIFNQRAWDMETRGFNFNSDMYRKRESRILFIGFTYRFGNTKMEQKRQNRREGGGDDGGGMDEF